MCCFCRLKDMEQFVEYIAFTDRYTLNSKAIKSLIINGVNDMYR